MRFKQFINEEVAGSKIDLTRFKNNIAAFSKNKNFLYRAATGVVTKRFKDTGLKMAVISGRTERRESISGGNLLLSIASKWKDLPDRSLSFFASQQVEHADSFSGELCMIIPADSVKSYAYTVEDFNFDETVKSRAIWLLACSEISCIYSDMFFEAARSEVVENIWKPLVKKYNLQKETFGEISVKDIDRAVSAVSELLELHLEELLDFILNDSKAKSRSFYLLSNLQVLKSRLRENGFSTVNELVENITPKEWGIFKANNVSSIPRLKGVDSEIWFEGDFLAISVSKADPTEPIKALMANT